MSAPVDIANLALSHLGADEIQDLESERSQGAKACRRFYAQARDEVLRDFPWPFATAIDALALVTERPNSEWAYAYRLPAGCLNFRRILSGFGRVDRPDTRAPYRLAQDSAGQLILTDQPEAVGEWTVLVEDAERYPPDFVQSVALLLAAYMAPKLTGGDPNKLGLRALQQYAWRVESAKANAANEEQADRPAESEYITVRN